MKPFSYKGHIIQASSKDEAIKIVAEKLKLQPISTPIKSKYLFHRSPPAFRASIVKQGLLPKIGDNYKWHWDEHFKPNELTKGVFLSDGRIYDTTYDDDLWVIEVSKLDKTKLFKDPDKDLMDCMLYTGKIPTSAIKLVYEGSGEADINNVPEKEILRKYK